MCRIRYTQGFCCIAFGAGLLLGWWIHSWLFCGLGAAAIIGLGISLLRGR